MAANRSRKKRRIKAKRQLKPSTLAKFLTRASLVTKEEFSDDLVTKGTIFQAIKCTI